MTNDSYQYLSIAKQAFKGNYGYTNLVTFDRERSYGIIPAPATGFPLGYSTLIALVGWFKVPVETAGWMISALSTAGCVPLLMFILTNLNLSRSLKVFAAGFFVCNASTIKFGSAVLSEALFCFLVLLAVTLILRAQQHNKAGFFLWVSAGMTFGAAYFVRYAGMFFILGVGFLVIRHAFLKQRNLLLGYLGVLLSASIWLFGGLLRNLMLTGNWRGGNEKVIENQLISIIFYTARALNSLILGPGTMADTGALRLAAIILFGIGIVCLMNKQFKQIRLKLFNYSPEFSGFSLDVAILIFVYSACMFYAGLTTVIDYNYRMFVPILPLVVILLFQMVDRVRQLISKTDSWRSCWRQRVGLTMIGLAMILYAYLNLLVLKLPVSREGETILKILDSKTHIQISVRDAVNKLTGPNGIIIANHGQALGYFLDHPTLSLVGPQYSDEKWDENAIAALVRRYNARAIVIAAWQGLQDNDDIIPSPFIRSLTQNSPPKWLSLAHRSEGVLVYKAVLENKF